MLSSANTLPKVLASPMIGRCQVFCTNVSASLKYFGQLLEEMRIYGL